MDPSNFLIISHNLEVKLVHKARQWNRVRLCTPCLIKFLIPKNSNIFPLICNQMNKIRVLNAIIDLDGNTSPYQIKHALITSTSNICRKWIFNTRIAVIKLRVIGVCWTRNLIILSFCDCEESEDYRNGCYKHNFLIILCISRVKVILLITFW